MITCRWSVPAPPMGRRADALSLRSPFGTGLAATAHGGSDGTELVRELAPSLVRQPGQRCGLSRGLRRPGTCQRSHKRSITRHGGKRSWRAKQAQSRPLACFREMISTALESVTRGLFEPTGHLRPSSAPGRAPSLRYGPTGDRLSQEAGFRLAPASDGQFQ